MKCKYCQAEVYIDDSNPAYQMEKSMVDRWECHDCVCHYATNKDGQLISTSWRAYVDGKLYFIKSYNSITGNAPEFIIAYYATNSEGKQYWEEVKRFDFVPQDWTPQNSKHKLKIYLPFL